uniref:Plant lipid transfer/seed storage/trypsin-alpha amylase inhibitor; Pistil-specific extensin n=1 Tax=Solanum tuberosum TaxID=4113 RepID=M1DN09_SOLTU
MDYMPMIVGILSIFLTIIMTILCAICVICLNARKQIKEKRVGVVEIGCGTDGLRTALVICLSGAGGAAVADGTVVETVVGSADTVKEGCCFGGGADGGGGCGGCGGG